MARSKDGDPTVAETLSKWMTHSHLTVMDLHKRTGISRETFYRTLGGDSVIGLDRLRLIAAELGTTAGAIIDGVLPPTGQVSPLVPPAGLEGRVSALERDVLDAARTAKTALELAQQLRASQSSRKSR